MATLAEIRAKLQEQENRGGGSSSSGGGDNAIFPFWNIPENSTSVLRFLPDGDASNTYFWRERQMIRLEFAGVKGDPNSRRVTVNVPCNEMWGPVGSCPVLSEVRNWFKDPNLEDMGRKYWKKRSYVFQGFVAESSLQEDTTPENPIRRFIINPSIFNIIKGALMDSDFVELPTDIEQALISVLLRQPKVSMLIIRLQVGLAESVAWIAMRERLLINMVCLISMIIFLNSQLKLN